MEQADITIDEVAELSADLDDGGEGLSRGTIKNARRGENITMRAAKLLVECSKVRPVKVHGVEYVLSFERLGPQEET